MDSRSLKVFHEGTKKQNFSKRIFCNLPHFMSLVPYYTPPNHQENYGFLRISEGMAKTCRMKWNTQGTINISIRDR